MLAVNTYLYCMSLQVLQIMVRDDPGLVKWRVLVLNTVVYVVMFVELVHALLLKPILYYNILTGKILECPQWFSMFYGSLKIISKLAHIVYLGYYLLMIWYLAYSHKRCTKFMQE